MNRNGQPVQTDYRPKLQCLRALTAALRYEHQQQSGWVRLRELATGMTEEQLRTLVVEEIEVEWVEEGSWVKRCILERYGCSIHRPVLDLDAEH